MGNIGESMTNPTIPAVGTAGTGYAATVNLFLAEVKQRLEAKVPLSSLLGGTLSMANSPIEDIQYLELYPQLVAPTTPVGSFQNFAGDVYWVSTSGAIKITNGAALNSAGIGGITGDYGGVNPAQLRFVDADETYYFYDDFGAGRWARLSGRSVDISGDISGAERVRISWLGTGASYTLTLPTVVPGSTSLVQMAASGQLSASNTVGSNITATDFLHTANRTVSIPSSAALDRLSTHTRSTGASSFASNQFIIAASSLPIVFPIPLEQGQTLTSYSLRLTKNTDGSALVRSRLYSTSSDSELETALAVGDSNSDNAPGPIGLEESGLSVVLNGDDEQLYLVFTPSGSATPANDRLYHLVYSYKTA